MVVQRTGQHLEACKQLLLEAASRLSVWLQHQLRDSLRPLIQAFHLLQAQQVTQTDAHQLVSHTDRCT